MGGLHPITWRPELNKKADPPWVRETSSYLVAFKREHQHFSAFLFKLKHRVLMPRACNLQMRKTPLILLMFRPSDMDWSCTTGPPGSAPCLLTPQILRLTSLHYPMSHFLLTNLTMYTSYWFCVFGELWWKHLVSSYHLVFWSFTQFFSQYF